MASGRDFDHRDSGLEILSRGGDEVIGAMMKHAPIFADFSDGELTSLAGKAWAYRAGEGTVLIEEGEEGGKLFVLIDGLVDIFKNDARGEPRKITSLGPGATLGEMSLVDALPFSATARVAEEATLLLLLEEDFVQLVDEHPDLHLKFFRRMTREMSLRLRQTTHALSSYLGKVADLTESLHTALANNRSKTEFIAGMSHELRTPLNAIIGFSEIFEEEVRSRDLGDSVADIKRIQIAGRHMLGLINNILDFGKLEAGRMSFQPSRFELSPLLEELKAMMEPLASANRNRLVLHEETPLGSMFTDKTKVMQVLINLLGNAGKFTKDGEITLRVWRKGDDDRGHITFEVRDTGIGIPAGQLSRLFKLFSQADSAVHRHFGGSGLGLYLSRYFCQHMGGDIAVESQEGKGSTFTLTLPAMMEPV